MSQSFQVLPPDPSAGIEHYTVMGVAADGQPSHYDIQRTLMPEFPNIDFDSEQGTFFAYAYGPKPAKRLCDVLNAVYGRTSGVEGVRERSLEQDMYDFALAAIIRDGNAGAGLSAEAAQHPAIAEAARKATRRALTILDNRNPS